MPAKTTKAKNPHAFDPGHKRTIRYTTRWSPKEFKRLSERAKKSGARNPASYLRAKALNGPDSRMPDYDMQRAILNAMTECTAEIRLSPPGPAKDRAMISAENAFDRIVP